MKKHIRDSDSRSPLPKQSTWPIIPPENSLLAISVLRKQPYSRILGSAKAPLVLPPGQALLLYDPQDFTHGTTTRL
jgi:hypothetical protein